MVSLPLGSRGAGVTQQRHQCSEFRWTAEPVSQSEAALELPGLPGRQVCETSPGLCSAAVGCKMKPFSRKSGSSSSSCEKCAGLLFRRALSSLRCLFQTLSSPTDFIPLRYSHTLLSRCAALCHLYVAYNVSESRSLAFLIRHHAILKTFFRSKMKV